MVGCILFSAFDSSEGKSAAGIRKSGAAIFRDLDF
jgi:hypothetical protein